MELTRIAQHQKQVENFRSAGTQNVEDEDERNRLLLMDSSELKKAGVLRESEALLRVSKA